MAGQIRVSLGAEDDGTGELFVHVQACGFAGQSSAWFDLSLLEEQVRRFLEYPLRADNPPSITGGYWDKDAKNIEQEHVHLSVKPEGLTGDLMLLARLAVSLGDYDDRKIRYSVSVELRINYERLGAFARDFIRLIHGEIEEALLDEIPS
jgi:hypothetical protein